MFLCVFFLCIQRPRLHICLLYVITDSLSFSGCNVFFVCLISLFFFVFFWKKNTCMYHILIIYITQLIPAIFCVLERWNLFVVFLFFVFCQRKRTSVHFHQTWDFKIKNGGGETKKGEREIWGKRWRRTTEERRWWTIWGSNVLFHFHHWNDFQLLFPTKPFQLVLFGFFFLPSGDRHH